MARFKSTRLDFKRVTNAISNIDSATVTLKD